MSEDPELNYLKWVKEQLADTRKRKSHEMDEETANLYTAVLALIDYLEKRGQPSSDRESSENLHLKVDQSVERDQRGIPRTRKCVVCGEWNHRMATYPPNAGSVLGVCDGCVGKIVREWWRENIERAENPTAEGACRGK